MPLSSDPTHCTHSPSSIQHDAQLAITACTSCGSVLSSSSSAGLQVLGRVLEEEEHERGRMRLWDGGVGYVGGVGRGMMNEGKSLVYHEKRKAESEKFMRQCCVYFGFPGLFQRTKTLFAQAKQIGKFKWGQNARMIAAACVYIAARERDKPIRLAELAGVNDLDFVTLTRAQFTVKYWLRIKTHEVDPVIHLERPIVHLAELFSSSSNPPLSGNPKKSHWSPSNLSFIRTLNLSHVRQLATSLLAFAVEVKLATGRNPEGVAAAAVVMAMEGVARELVPSPSDFFDELGHLFTMKAYTIGERHKEFGHLLTDWAGSLPWLKDEVGKVKGKKLKKLVAENMADIVELRKGLERKRGEAEIKEEAAGREVRKAKKEESEEEEEGEEDEEDVDWDDDEGEDDPPGGPSNFFIDPLFNPQAAADTLRAGDGPNTTTTTTTDLNPELKPNSPVPGPPYLSTWSQLAATFHARRIEGGGGGKRPAQYMRHRPGPVKRVRTIESVAQSLLSPFADGPTSTPSPAPPEVEASASPSSATLRPTASASTSPPRARSASLPIIDTASVAPKRRFVDPSRANPFASHSNEAVAFRQLLLAGHDVTSIFEGTAQYEPSSALKSSRLDRLLWVKRVEEVEDDELFDEGELEAIIRTGEEIEMLKRTEKWLTMPEAKVPLSATEGGRKNPRQRKKPRTRVPRRKGPSLEEEEEIERIRAGKTTTMGRPVGSGGGGGGVQRSRRTKVSQDMKERLLKVLEAPDEEEGDEEEEEAFNLGMAMDVAAASEEDDADEDEGSDSDFL